MRSAVFKALFFLMFCMPLAALQAQTTTTANAKPYAALKAVLVVGHSEGNGTENSIRSMNKIADSLRERGIKTHCFYDAEAQWAKIKEAAKGADLFLYNGHGSFGGGLNIETGGTTADIMNLQLSTNAVVGFQSVCYGAGSSASDDEEMSIAEAAKRVTWYAEPFLKAGAACYYASNWDDGVLQFLNRFFDGQTSKACFEYCKVDTLMPFGADATKQLGLCSIDLGGTFTRTSYHNGVKTVKEVPSHRSFEVAWVGNPKLVLKDLLK